MLLGLAACKASVLTIALSLWPQPSLYDKHPTVNLLFKNIRKFCDSEGHLEGRLRERTALPIPSCCGWGEAKHVL